MGYITLGKCISQADYKMLLNEIMVKRSDSKLREFCYWAAKFCTEYPAEGYGIYNPQVTISSDFGYEITWQCRDNCD